MESAQKRKKRTGDPGVLAEAVTSGFELLERGIKTPSHRHVK